MYGFDARCIPHYISYTNVRKDVFLVLASERDTRIWDAEKMTAVRIHCFVAEEHLGRSLAPGEVVHLVNGDWGNNRPENCACCPARATTWRWSNCSEKSSEASSRCLASTSC